MRRFPRLTLALVFALLMALGAVQGRRVRHLRESEAFYRWLQAAAVNERLFQEEAGENRDAELFAQCNAVAGELQELAREAAARGAREIERERARRLVNQRAVSTSLSEPRM